MNWRLWSWKDVAGVAFVVLAVGGMTYLFLFVPHSGTNYGFSPDMDCHSPGPGYDPVCVKKRTPGAIEAQKSK
jgi:hypothetical protein